jgi:hypothetical protein
MSTSKSKNQKDKSKLTMCKNCHQDILKDKMFLHEGFCIRNNVYCEHCERVFLKNDYEDHIKTIPKNLSKNKNDSQSQNQKSPETRSESGRPNSTTDHNDSINNFNDNNEPLYPMPSLEFVQMPPTELFHINNPIIIAENGEIVSNKNKNEFLLPYLGINTFQPSQKSEEVINEIINQGEIFKENNNISISRNSYRIEDLEKILNKENINSSNKLKNSQNKQNMRESNRSNYSGYQMNNNENLRLSEQINEYYQNRNNKSKSFINNMNYTDVNTDINDNIQINNNLKSEKELKNFITLNNKVLKNNSNKNVGKINQFFNQEETPKKPSMIYSLKNKNLNISNNNVFDPIPLDKNSIKSYHIQLGKLNNTDNDLSNNANISGNKEPKDSNSKRNQIYQCSGQKIPVNTSFKPQSEKREGKKSLKRCEFCNIAFNSNETNNHYKICKMKKESRKKVKKFDIPKPKKREKYFTEINPLENIDENGLDDKKRATLKRKFNAALNVISLNNGTNISRGVVSNPDRKYKNDIIIKENKKISLKKKLFHFNDENSQNFQNVQKKDFPEDSNRIENASKTQKRMYRIKRINNLSVDGNNVDLFSNTIRYIKLQRSPGQPMLYNVNNTYNADSTAIDPWLYFYDNFNVNKNKH